MSMDDLMGVPEPTSEHLDDILGDTPPEPKKKRGRRGIVYFILILLLCLPLVFIGFYAVTATMMLNNIKRDPAAMPTETNRPPVTSYAYQNIVLMGSDSRTTVAGQGRSDVLMVAHINATRDKVYLISFPRDMYVSIPGRGMGKINAAFAYGGPALTVRTLEGLLNLRMNHTALIDFDGFIRLTDSIGGVTVYNKYATQGACVAGQPQVKYPVGEITISGEPALCYVRQRYDLPNGDLDRAQRQRAVMKAIIVKMFRPEVIANPVTFAQVAGQLSQFISVDSGFSVDEMRNLALSMRINGSNDIVMMQAPISGFASDPVAGAIDVVNTKQMAELASAMATDSMVAYADKYGVG